MYIILCFCHLHGVFSFVLKTRLIHFFTLFSFSLSGVVVHLMAYFHLPIACFHVLSDMLSCTRSPVSFTQPPVSFTQSPVPNYSITCFHLLNHLCSVPPSPVFICFTSCFSKCVACFHYLLVVFSLPVATLKPRTRRPQSRRRPLHQHPPALLPTTRPPCLSSPQTPPAGLA